YLPNARADNAIAYKGTFNGFTAGGTFSLGRDGVNAGPSPAGTNCPGEGVPDSSACRQWSVMLAYDTTGWGAAAAIDRQYGGPGAFGALISSQLQDTRKMVNGYVKLGAFKLGAGFMRRDNEGSVTSRSDLIFLGASYQATLPLTLEVEAFDLDFHDSANE